MSYEKLGFQKGQLLKAEHLNHIEEGIAGMSGCGCVHAMVKRNDEGDLVLLHTTFDELKNAFLNDIPVHYIEYNGDDMNHGRIGYSDSEDAIFFNFNGEQHVLYPDGSIEIFAPEE